MSELKTNLQEILQEKQEKIIPENIKKDVQIFDVVGTLDSGGITINNQDKTITTNGQYTADEGYTGLGTVTVQVPQDGDVEPIFATVDYSAKNIVSQSLNTEDKTNVSISAMSDYVITYNIDTSKTTAYLFKLNDNNEYELIKNLALSYSGRIVISKVTDDTVYFTELPYTDTTTLLGYSYNIITDELKLIKSVRYTHNTTDYILNDYNTNYAFIEKPGGGKEIYELNYDTLEFTKCANTPLEYLNGSNYQINNCVAPDIFINCNNNYSMSALAKFNRESNTFTTKTFVTESQGYIAGISYDNTKIFIKDKGIYALNSDLSIGNLISNTNIPCENGYFLFAINDKYYLKLQRMSSHKGGNYTIGYLYEFNDETNEFSTVGTLYNILYHPGHLYTVDVSQTSSDIYNFIPGNTQIGISYNGKTYYDTDTNPISNDKVLDGYQVYSKSYQPVIGTMSNNGALEITPSVEEQTIPEGYTSGGKVLGDANLKPENIKAGITIFGVTGTLESPISQEEYNTALETAKDISGKEFYEIPYDYNTNLDIIKNVKVGDAIIARPLTNLLNPEIDNFSYNSNTGKSITIYANDLGVANPSGYREYLEVTIRDTTGGNGFVGLQYIKKASEADIIYNSWTWKYVNQPLIDIGMYDMNMASGYDGPGWYDTAQYEWGTTYIKKTQEDIDVLIDYILRANLIVYNVNTWSSATEEESQQMNDILARIIQVDKKGE